MSKEGSKCTTVSTAASARKYYFYRLPNWSKIDVRTGGPNHPSQGGPRAQCASLACSQPPEGAARWTVRLLTIAARHRPKLEGVNRESIRQILKKTSVNLGAK